MLESRAAQATEALKDLLVSCVLEPGGCYTEAQISGLLDLGKTPVREALTLLVEHGWMQPIKGRGYEILPVTFGAVRDLFATRQLLEPHAAELAAGRVDRVEAERLLGLCSPEPDYNTVAGRLAATKQNRALHVGIVANAGNAVLTELVTRLLERTDRLAFIVLGTGGWKSGWADDHVDLVAALSAGDGPVARTLLTDHIEQAERAAIDVLLDDAAVEQLAVPLPSDIALG